MRLSASPAARPAPHGPLPRSAATLGALPDAEQGCVGPRSRRYRAYGHTHTCVATRLYTRARVPSPLPPTGWLSRLLGNFELSVSPGGTHHRRGTLSLGGAAPRGGGWDRPWALSAVGTLQRPWGSRASGRGLRPGEAGGRPGPGLLASRDKCHVTRAPCVALWMRRGLSPCCHP